MVIFRSDEVGWEVDGHVGGRIIKGRDMVVSRYTREIKIVKDIDERFKRDTRKKMRG